MRRIGLKLYALCFFIHLLAGVLATVAVAVFSLAVMDGGGTVAPWWLLVLHYVSVALSLPFVYPLMESGEPSSWLGLVLLIVAAVVESALVAAPIAYVVSFLRARRERRYASA